jgi:hypothetical protein
VINFSRARFAAQKVTPDKALQQDCADDHEVCMTSLVGLVLCVFE